ncbi:hypothetical protein R520_01190 [Salmonella enterica subsp. enterica serovar Cerro]|nr:hypothetical protein R521_02885 [Salmonella enterica subsp. enterica serovar Cerro]OSE24246.1 hypothetical protein R520_01190 [Salmonella enterica subsp. enterica serovar Cerro]
MGPPFDFLLNFCSCQTARCFNKSKGVLITDLKLKAFRNPQPSWGFSIDNKNGDVKSPFLFLTIIDITYSR